MITNFIFSDFLFVGDIIIYFSLAFFEVNWINAGEARSAQMFFRQADGFDYSSERKIMQGCRSEEFASFFHSFVGGSFEKSFDEPLAGIPSHNRIIDDGYSFSL